MSKAKEIKLMIIENYINHITSDEVEREIMKHQAAQYVEEDHVDEITQAGFEFRTTEDKRVENAARYLANDYDEVCEILKNIDEIEDGSIMMDDVEGVSMWEPLEYTFTVDQFLEII